MGLPDVRRFADFAEEPAGLEGDKLQLDRVLNREILVTGYRILPSRYPGKNKSGDMLQLQFKITGPGADVGSILPNILFTGSDVLISQSRKYAAQIPFYARIVKINRHYTFQ